VENPNPREELKRLDEQIQSATGLAELKPIFHRLNEIIRGFPDDFDVQLTGDEIKQRLIARGTLLKELEAFQPPPPAPPEQPPPALVVTPENPPQPPTRPPAPPPAPAPAPA